MRCRVAVLVASLVACGGKLEISTPPPPPDADVADVTPDAGKPPGPLVCNDLPECLDGGCSSAPPSQPVAVVSGQTDIIGLATDGSYVYWVVNQAMGQVMECATSGCGNQPSVFANSQPNPFAIAADGAMIYWLDGPSGAVVKCAGGSGCGAPVTILSGLWNPWNILAAGDGHVFFSVMKGPLMTCPESGCPAPITVAPVGRLGAVAVGGTNVYWRDDVSGDVLACDASHCTAPTKLAASQGTGSITATTCGAYWVEPVGPSYQPTGGSIVTCPSTGCGGQPIVIAPNEPFPGPIAADASGVYWASADGTLKTCELGGCAQPRIVASGVGVATALALDASNVYLATPHAISRIPK